MIPKKPQKSMQNCFIFSALGWGKGKVSGCVGKVKFQVSNRWWRWAWNVSHHHVHHRCTSPGHRLVQYHSPARHHLNASDTLAAVQMDVELASNSHANGSSPIPEKSCSACEPPCYFQPKGQIPRVVAIETPASVHTQEAFISKLLR